MARETAVAPRVVAVERMVEKVPGADWGWKGGKPGELSGKDYLDTIKEFADEFGQLELDDSIGFASQLLRSKYPAIRAAAEDPNLMDRVYRGFARMEKTGIPREWTGKVMNAILQSDIPAGPKTISDLMRPMTNDQRQALLNLLPRWTGTLETAASAAKKLYRR